MQKARILIAIAVLLAAGTAEAEVAPQTNVVVYTRNTTSGVISTSGAGSVNLLDAVALNSAAASLTVIIPTGKKVSEVEVDLQITTDGGLTAVTATISCNKVGSVYATRTTESCASGTCTLYQKTWTYGPTTGDVISIQYDARTCENVKVIINDAGADAGDTVVLNAQGVTGL